MFLSNNIFIKIMKIMNIIFNIGFLSEHIIIIFIKINNFIEVQRLSHTLCNNLISPIDFIAIFD